GNDLASNKSYGMLNLFGRIDMSEHQSEPVSTETGTLGTTPAAPDMSASGAPVTAAAEIESPKIAPEQEETAPKADAPKVEAVKVEAPKVEAPKVEVPKVDAVKPEAPRFPGKVVSPGDHAGAKAEAEPGEAKSGKRRVAAM